MLPVSEWLPPMLAGSVFTVLGILKLYGLRRGLVGGRSKPFTERLCGT